jgi:hypothetical protein
MHNYNTLYDKKYQTNLCSEDIVECRESNLHDKFLLLQSQVDINTELIHVLHKKLLPLIIQYPELANKCKDGLSANSPLLSEFEMIIQSRIDTLGENNDILRKLIDDLRI